MFYSMLVVHHTLPYWWMWRWVRSCWGIRSVLPGLDVYGAVVGVFLGLMVVWCHIPMTQVGQSGQPLSLILLLFLPGFILLKLLFVYSFLSPEIVPHLLPSFSGSPGHGGSNFPSSLSCRGILFKAGWQTCQHCWRVLQQIPSTNPWPFFALPAKDGDNYLSVIT